MNHGVKGSDIDKVIMKINAFEELNSQEHSTAEGLYIQILNNVKVSHFFEKEDGTKLNFAETRAIIESIIGYFHPKYSGEYLEELSGVYIKCCE